MIPWSNFTLPPAAVEFKQFIDDEEEAPPAPKRGMGSAENESVWWEPANAQDAWDAVVALCRGAR